MQSTPYRTPGAGLTTGLSQPAAGYLDGGKPLWKAFWLVHMLGLVIVYASVRLTIDSLGESINALVRGWDEYVLLTALQEVYGLLGFAPLLVYLSFSLLVVWRCARNTRWRGWTAIARLIALLCFLFAAAMVAYCLWRIV